MSSRSCSSGSVGLRPAWWNGAMKTPKRSGHQPACGRVPSGDRDMTASSHGCIVCDKGRIMRTHAPSISPDRPRHRRRRPAHGSPGRGLHPRRAGASPRREQADLLPDAGGAHALGLAAAPPHPQDLPAGPGVGARRPGRGRGRPGRRARPPPHGRAGRDLQPGVRRPGAVGRRPGGRRSRGVTRVRRQGLRAASR